jgi:glycosyltransferase involved in cell wall biosynthesis
VKKPHVIILVENLPVPFDRRVWMEASTLQQNGYRVSVICPATKTYPKRKEVIDGILIYRYPGGLEGRSSIGTLLEYLWAVSWMFVLTLKISIRTKVNVVHLCNPPDLLFIASLPAKILRRSKIIFDQHDICPELWESKGHKQTDFYGRLLTFFEKVTYTFSDVVISTNQSYKDIAMKRGAKKTGDVFIVRSAPKRDFASQVKLKTRAPDQAGKLVYLGTMGSQEGIDLLLSAVRILKEELGRNLITLSLIGDGPERPYLESMTAELALNTNVNFLGRVSDDILKKTVLDADIAVNPDRPSKMNDLSSMNKIVEYMALGLPIVQFSCLEGERTALDAGLSVKTNTARALAETLHDLLSDETARERMRVFGKSRFISDLAWELQEETLLAAYSHVLQK